MVAGLVLLGCAERSGTDPDIDLVGDVSVSVEDNPLLVLEKRVTATVPEPGAAALLCEASQVEGEVHRMASDAPSVSHSFALRGLLPETGYRCEVEVGARRSTFGVETGPLPFDTPLVERIEHDGQRRGYTLLNHQVARDEPREQKLLLLDDLGRVRWYQWLGEPKDLDAQWLGDGRILMGGGYSLPPTIVDLGGQVQWQGPPAHEGQAYHHHAELLPNGLVLTLVTASNEGPGGVFEGFEVWLIDPAADLVVWSWSSQQAVDAGRLPDGGDDPFHANAVQMLDDGDLLVGLRNHHAAMRIDGGTGDVEWVAGPGHDFALLDTDGKPLAGSDWFFGPHAAELGPEGLLVYDNGWARSDGTRWSSALLLTLDEEEREARVAWRHTEEGWYQPIWGDVDLHGDSVIVTKGRCPDCSSARGSSEVLEVDRATGAVLWRLRFLGDEDAVYRSERIDGCAVFAWEGACPSL